MQTDPEEQVRHPAEVTEQSSQDWELVPDAKAYPELQELQKDVFVQLRQLVKVWLQVWQELLVELYAYPLWQTQTFPESTKFLELSQVLQTVFEEQVRHPAEIAEHCWQVLVFVPDNKAYPV